MVSTQLRLLGSLSLHVAKQQLNDYAVFVYKATEVILTSCGDFLFVPGTQNLLQRLRVALVPTEENTNGPHAGMFYPLVPLIQLNP